MSTQERDEAIHPASEVKLARARQQGELCRSYSLAQALQVAVGLGVLGLSIWPLTWALLEWTRDYWASGAGIGRSAVDLPELLVRIGWPLGLLLLGLFALGCVSHWLQTGWNWGQRPLMKRPNWQLDQVFRQWYSPGRWVVALAAIVCCAGLLAWCWSSGTAELNQLGQLWSAPSEELLKTGLAQMRTWLLPVVGCLLVLGGLDYALQRWSYFQRMQMTDQELRDEQKDEQNLARSAMKKRKVKIR